MTPDRWTARPSGVSLPKAKCVHSRRTVPIRRSKYGFCHGDPGEIGPRARTAMVTQSNFASVRSRQSLAV